MKKFILLLVLGLLFSLKVRAAIRDTDNTENGVVSQSHRETTAQRAVSRLRRTNDRSVLRVHEDHEDDENAENGVVQWSQRCFLLKEGNKFIKQEGDCKSRHSPCSTFKIAISLMGYNEGLLIDEFHPEIPFIEAYPAYIEAWKKPHNPSLWLKNSCVWYSQVLTRKLGMKKFKKYIREFKYGNKDISGDKGLDNGLTESWLSSSLQISPEEQLKFLQKLLDNKLPVSLKAHTMTRNILFIEELADGWKLYGKTGSGVLLNKDGTENPDRQIGWFIGWVEKADRKIVFSYYIQDDDKQDTYAGQRAKQELIVNLIANLSKYVNNIFNEN
ncbi:MAG: class D beta-lactamase [bacterium]